MKLSPETLRVLRNFAAINPSILVKPGQQLSTISPKGRSVLARAAVPDTFENEFAIYDLNRFLGALSLLDDPQLVIGARALMATSEGRTLSYALAEPSMIVVPPNREIAMPETFVEVDMPDAVFKAASSALRVLGLPEVAFVGRDGGVFLEAVDSKGVSNDVYALRVASRPEGKRFSAVFKIDNLKLLPGDYAVTLTAKGIAKFTGPSAEYFVSVEKSSVFQ